MKSKNNFMGIIIPVVVAVILLTVLPIINSINVECPPCEACPPCEEMPTLYTPTISISDDTLTITPNSNNGAFVTGYKIYVDDTLLDTITSTTYDLSEEITELGTYEIYVTAYAIRFEDSEPSNAVEYVVEPIPSGYTVTLTTSLYRSDVGYVSYSLDNGVNWTDILTISDFPIIINNVTTIKFKITQTSNIIASIKDTTADVYLVSDRTTSWIGDTITLSSNNTYDIEISYD